MIGGVPIYSWAGLASLLISLASVAYTLWFVRRSARYRAESRAAFQRIAAQLADAVEQNYKLSGENIELRRRLLLSEAQGEGTGQC